MNLHDILTEGHKFIADNRPNNPDMDRITEIVLHMKALTSEARSPEEHEANWIKHINSLIDFDALAWQALNVAFDVFGIRTADDYIELKRYPTRYNQFLGSMQAFYDGFLLGAEFQKKGGHRE